MKIYLYIFILIVYLLTSEAYAERNPVPAYMANNNMYGREFIIAIPPNEKENYEAKSLEIFVSSPLRTTVTLKYDDAPPVTKEVLPNSWVEFSSSAGDISWELENRISEEINHKAIHISSVDPVAVFVMNSKQFTSEAYTAIPVDQWGQDYIHCSFYDFKEVDDWSGGFVIASAYDDTEIKVLLNGKKFTSKTQKGRKKGDTITVTLNKGDTYMVMGDAKTRGQSDLTGSRVISSKPIGLISFHMRTMIPSFNLNNGRQFLMEMMPPVHAYGKKYATLELNRGRNKGDFFRMVASEPNTNIICKTFDIKTGDQVDTRLFTLEKAGDFEEYRHEDVTPEHNLTSLTGINVFESTKPFMLMQYSYSSDWDGNNEYDPFMIIVPPIEQYTSSGMVFLPADEYKKTDITLFAIHDQSFSDSSDLKSIHMDGKSIWSTENITEFYKDEIPGTNIYRINIKSSSGAHIIDSRTKLGAYSYGTTGVNSFGTMSIMSTNLLTKGDIKPPEFQHFYKGGACRLRIMDFSGSGISRIELTDQSRNARICFPNYFRTDTIVDDYTVYIEPIRDDTATLAILAFSDKSGNITLDTIQLGTFLRFSPDFISFGGLPLKDSATRTIKAYNSSNVPFFINSISSLDNDCFSIVNDLTNIPYFIKAGGADTFQISVKFKPGKIGEEQNPERDTIVIETNILNGAKKYKYPVSGYGIDPSSAVSEQEKDISELMNLSPNPVNDGIIKIKASIDITEPICFMLVNALGEKLYYTCINEGIIAGQSYSLDITDITPGVYLALITYGNNKHVIKVIVAGSD